MDVDYVKWYKLVSQTTTSLVSTAVAEALAWNMYQTTSNNHANDVVLLNFLGNIDLNN